MASQGRARSGGVCCQDEFVRRLRGLVGEAVVFVEGLERAGAVSFAVVEDDDVVAEEARVVRFVGDSVGAGKSLGWLRVPTILDVLCDPIASYTRPREVFVAP